MSTLLAYVVWMDGREFNSPNLLETPATAADFDLFMENGSLWDSRIRGASLGSLIDFSGAVTIVWLIQKSSALWDDERLPLILAWEENLRARLPHVRVERLGEDSFEEWEATRADDDWKNDRAHLAEFERWLNGGRSEVIAR